MDPREFHRRLHENTVELMRPGGGVVCGVSGGADSMAMLHGLHAVNGAYRCNWRLHVGHLDHGLREDAATDARFVEDQASALGLACMVRAIQVAATVRETGETTEEAGRRLRYEFLAQLAVDTGAEVIAVAHQADDQAETVLHHITRGTGVAGLAGMRASRPVREGSPIRLVRPLLGFRRRELREYLEARGLLFREDHTNQDAEAGTRNRIRQQVLPQLEEFVNPEVVAALCRLSRQADRVQEAIRQQSAVALNQARIRRTDTAVILSAQVFAALPWAVRTEVVMEVLRGLGAGLKAFSFERIEAAAEAAVNGDGGRRTIELPGGFVVERRGGEVCFRRVVQGMSPEQRDDGGEGLLPDGGFSVER